MLLLKRYFTNPCEGNCLVKASCRIAKQYPWTRTDKCPEYAQWRKRDKTLTETKEWSITIFFGIMYIIIALWIGITFAIGLYREFKYIAGFF